MNGKIKSFGQLGDALKKLFKDELVVMFHKYDHKKSIGYHIFSRPSNENLEFNVNFEVVKKGFKNTNTDRFFVFRLEMKKIIVDYEWISYEVKESSKDPQEIFDIIKNIKENNGSKQDE